MHIFFILLFLLCFVSRFFFLRPLQIYANVLMPIKYFHENEELLRPKLMLLFILGTSYSFHIPSPNDACVMYSIVLTKHIIILYSFALWCMVCVSLSVCVAIANIAAFWITYIIKMCTIATYFRWCKWQ